MISIKLRIMSHTNIPYLICHASFILMWVFTCKEVKSQQAKIVERKMLSTADSNQEPLDQRPYALFQLSYVALYVRESS